MLDKLEAGKMNKYTKQVELMKYHNAVRLYLDDRIILYCEVGGRHYVTGEMEYNKG